MEDTLSVNRFRRTASCIVFFKSLLFIVCLTRGSASAQCDLAPREWIDRLSEIEESDAMIEAKLRQLSALRQDLEACDDTPDSVHARIAHRLGDFYRLSGDFQEGIELTSEAVAINRRANAGAEQSYLTHSYYNLGLYNLLLGFSRTAHLYFDSCIAIGTSFSEKLFIAFMALEKKAFMHFQAGDYAESIRTSEYGIALARMKSLPDYEALLLIQKAQAEAELRRMTAAENDIRKALSIIEKYHLDPWLPNAWSVYAHVLGRKMAYQEAIGYYTKAFNLNTAYGNALQSARDLNDLALLYDRDLKDADNSIRCYTRAVTILEKLEDPYMLAATYNNLGQVCWRKKDYEMALNNYQKALRALPMDFRNNDVSVNPDVEALMSVSNAYIPAALLWNKGNAWLGLYSRDRDALMLERALEAYRIGDRMVDEMRWRQQGEQSKVFWREKTKEWYTRAVEASFLLDDPEKAFYFMEKSRAVLLNDKLAELGARNQLPPGEAEKENALRVSVQSLEAMASQKADTGVNYRNALWRARNEMGAFIKTLEAMYPSYYRYKYDTAVVALAEVQNHLQRDGGTWLEIFTNDSTVFALTVTPQGAAIKRIDFGHHDEVAKAITDLCSASNSINMNFGRYRVLSHMYYNKVFEPLAIAPGRVTVSQDEYFLPFDLLQSDSVNGTSFLVKDYAFSYAYSASSFLRDGRRQEPARRSLLGVAPVTYDSRLQLQDLSGADKSLENIRASYSNGIFVTNEEATRSEFMRQVSDFDVIHLYSHAEADTLGNEPVLYFYDSALNLSDLYTLKTPRARMVVLFACNTGVGKAVRGEGIFSLARGFAAAGIPSTVSALWQIDNKTTYALSELFFQNLARGLPSDLALQGAKLELMDTFGKESELPYFWAGVVLIGRPAVYSPSGVPSLSYFNVAILLAAGTLLVGVITFAIRRRPHTRSERQSAG